MVYNNARIALAERAWELASLRVLGFTRGEVSALLLGELAIVIALAHAARLFLGGTGCAALLVALTARELFEFPLVILPAHLPVCGALVRVGGRRGERARRAQVASIGSTWWLS